MKLEVVVFPDLDSQENRCRSEKKMVVPRAVPTSLPERCSDRDF